MNYINISANRNNPDVVDYLPFRALGNYIADKKHDSAKVDCFWAVNCASGASIDDLDAMNHEIEWVQAQNDKVTTRKTLHVSLSLPEGESLTHEQWMDAEAMLAKALGLEEYQRVVALHNDTRHHQHLNIGYNLIHPEKFTKCPLSNDFQNGSDICRVIEQKYGLKRDVGFREAQHKDGRSPGSRNMEAHTWHQSFESFVIKQRDAILRGLEEANDWQGVHQVFAGHELKLKLRGNGLVIAQGKQHIKASTLHRSCSRTALEKRFGTFRPKSRSAHKTHSKGKKYRLRPRLSLKGNGQRQLWSTFLNRKKHKPTISWKEYLMLMEGFDPLAMAIIKLNKSMIDTLSLPRRNARATPPLKAPYSNHGLLEAHDMGAFEETALTQDDIITNIKGKPTDKDFGM